MKSFGRNIKLMSAFMILGLCLLLGNKAMAATSVETNGALAVRGTKLVSQKTGQPVVLHGVSTHGINWDVGYPHVNYETFKYLRDNCGVNAVRLAMYTEEYNGYCAGGNKAELEATIDKGVQAATNLGMYVIIDWHILHDLTPVKHEQEAAAFLAKMAQKYAGYNNIIYEICNEPNGGTSWAEIRGYATRVIPYIRRYDPDAVVIVGTPNWSQDVDEAAKSPVPFDNVMYTLHFYSGTHKQWLRDKMNTALNSGLPIMVTEFGVSDASGDGNLDLNEANAWLNALDANDISYFAWSLSKKNESSALLSGNGLSTAGKWVFTQYKARSAKIGPNSGSYTNPGSNTASTGSVSANGRINRLVVGNLKGRRVGMIYDKVPGAYCYQIVCANNGRFRGANAALTRNNYAILNGGRIGWTYYIAVRPVFYKNRKVTVGAWSPIRATRVVY